MNKTPLAAKELCRGEIRACCLVAWLLADGTKQDDGSLCIVPNKHFYFGVSLFGLLPLTPFLFTHILPGMFVYPWTAIPPVAIWVLYHLDKQITSCTITVPLLYHGNCRTAPWDTGCWAEYMDSSFWGQNLQLLLLPGYFLLPFTMLCEMAVFLYGYADIANPISIYDWHQVTNDAWNAHSILTASLHT